MTTPLHGLQEAADRISKWIAYAGGMLLLLAALIVSFEVVARKLFNYSLVGADELSGYALGVSMAWGFSYALFRRGHLRVDVVYNRLPPIWARWVDALSMLCFLLVTAFLTFRAYQVVHETLAMDVKASTPLNTPLWIPQVPWFLGLLFFTICLAILLARCCLALARRDYDLVRDIAGAPSAYDEVAEIEASQHPAGKA